MNSKAVMVWVIDFKTTYSPLLQEILQNQFDTALNTCKQQIGKVLDDIRNVDDR